MCNLYHCEDGKEHASCSKPQQIILGEKSGKYGLHTKSISNKGIGLHYAQKNVEWEHALHYTHACVLMHHLYNGAG